MNLDKWIASCREMDYSPEELQIAENIAKNRHWIEVPRGVRREDVLGFLYSAVWVINTDWSTHRDELKAYNEHVLPYLKSTGTVDAVPRPISTYGGVYGAVDARESGTDLRRALKELAKDVTGGKPCNDLVASVLNAALELPENELIEPHNISRL